MRFIELKDINSVVDVYFFFCQANALFHSMNVSYDSSKLFVVKNTAGSKNK